MEKDLLYHYTTGGALLGMLRDYNKDSNPNLTMWATHYNFMNDPTEFVTGEKICNRAINKIEKELGIPKESKVRNVIAYKEFESIIRGLNRTMAISVDVPKRISYLVSFSRKFDCLALWNMYAQNGNGISLVFSKEKMIDGHLVLTNCLYETINPNLYNKIKQEYQSCIDELLKNKINYNDIYKFLSTYFTAKTIYIKYGSFIKNRAYKDEKECRLIAGRADKTLFREKNGMIIPYVEQKIPFDCLDSIMVGPTADFERVRESILLFLESKGIKWEEDKIKKSKVPYRN